MWGSANTPRLETPRLVVRLAERADVAAVLRYTVGNREFLRPWEPARSEAYYTEAVWMRQIEANRDEWRQDKSVRMFLFERDFPKRVVGICNINNIMRGPAQWATLGYGLAQHAEGQGLMYEALQAVVPYCFDTLNLNRVCANYLPRNQRSGDLLRRSGFTVEGYARAYLEINGVWEDHILTAKVNPSGSRPTTASLIASGQTAT